MAGMMRAHWLHIRQLAIDIPIMTYLTERGGLAAADYGSIYYR